MNDASLTSPSRGDTTREALIAAAIEAFGRQGFAAASTRAIAEAAGVNQALIGYHFNGKPGLYRAALQHIASAVQGRMGPLVASIEAELGIREPEAAGGPAARPAATAARCLSAVHTLTDAFVAMLTSDESAAWARLILREQQDPSEGFDLLYSGIMSRLLNVTAALVGRIRGSDPAAAETRLTTLALLGQALVFRTGRAAVMRQMGWPAVGAAEVATIQAEIRRNATAILEREARP